VEVTVKYAMPSVHLIGETQIVPEGLLTMLEALGVPEWHSDGASDAEVITEVAGKLCYLSFDTSLNKNLTRTGTRTNAEYIQEGLIATRHGSVLEHCVLNLAFINVSRIFTHELVRHRVGAAYSQTSGRYVRSKALSFFRPKVIKDNIELAELFDRAVEFQEQSVTLMEKASKIGTMLAKGDFPLKKALTSAFRRIVGGGVSTNILASYNHRALRHLIEQRTSRHAEEEIRLVFNEVAELVSSRYPAIYADMDREWVDGYWEYTFTNQKV
jgi:thymidylate synthase (FAD)